MEDQPIFYLLPLPLYSSHGTKYEDVGLTGRYRLESPYVPLPSVTDLFLLRPWVGISGFKGVYKRQDVPLCLSLGFRDSTGGVVRIKGKVWVVKREGRTHGRPSSPL